MSWYANILAIHVLYHNCLTTFCLILSWQVTCFYHGLEQLWPRAVYPCLFFNFLLKIIWVKNYLNLTRCYYINFQDSCDKNMEVDEAKESRSTRVRYFCFSKSDFFKLCHFWNIDPKFVIFILLLISTKVYTRKYADILVEYFSWEGG